MSRGSRIFVWVLILIAGVQLYLLWRTRHPGRPPLDEGAQLSEPERELVNEIRSSGQPVLVDFGATWCGPCRTMEPVIAQIERDYDGRIRVYKIDVDENPGLAARHVVRGIPAFVFFRQGEEVDRITGTRSLADLSEWIDGHLSAVVSAAEQEG